MASPLVSIVIRSMDRPALATALASVAAQDYANIELVLVNALGAGHAPPPVALGNCQVRFIDGQSRRTRPQAANVGHDAATGDWITFLDDDDTLLPTHVSGLVAALARAGTSRVVHSLAVVRTRDGSERLFGQPFAVIDLYQRSFIQMSTALWSRSLRDEGCRFDETLTIHQDWDFFLQCAQRTTFHFERLRTMLWNADQGGSGTFGGANFDGAEFARVRDQVYAKWQPQFDALVARIEPLLAAATQAVQRGNFDGAQQALAQLFELSPDDPSALNAKAMMQRAQGDVDGALATQLRSVMLRPYDHALSFNLALLYRARGDRAEALRHARVAARLAPGFAPAQRLVADMGGA